MDEVFDHVISETVTVNVNGRLRKMTLYEFMLRTMMNQAAKGDARMMAMAMKRAKDIPVPEILPEAIRLTMTFVDPEKTETQESWIQPVPNWRKSNQY